MIELSTATFGKHWRNRLPKSPLDKPLRVLEVGAGIGTMIERMLSRKLLNYAVYTAIDTQEQNKDLVVTASRLVFKSQPSI